MRFDWKRSDCCHFVGWLVRTPSIKITQEIISEMKLDNVCHLENFHDCHFQDRRFAGVCPSLGDKVNPDDRATEELNKNYIHFTIRYQYYNVNFSHSRHQG